MKPTLQRIAMLALTALFCVTAVAASAQTRTVTGTVTGPDNLPVVGATVIAQERNEKNAAALAGGTTDMNGKYSLKLPEKASVLSFQFIGYETQSVAIGSRSVIDAKLAESSVMMDEVVAIGYAKVRRKDLTGSTVSVVGSDLALAPVATAAQALTGKAAGVNVVTQSGAPGADINITVRGGTSITQSTAPLYIVDGFQMGNALQVIDINDIESIDVMKDASSTAIYGARGSNGVILITTKSGKKGKSEISYNTYFSFEKLGKKLDLLNSQEYAGYQYEWQILAGKEDGWASMFGGDPAAADFYTGAYARIAQMYGGRAAIDWQDVVFGGTAVTQNHNINLTAGTDKTQLMLSYNYTGQEGIMEKRGFNKNSVRAKVNHELFKGIRLDFGASFQNTKLEGGGAYSGLKNAILQPATGGVMYTDEQLINTDVSADMQKVDTQYDIYNPILENRSATQLKFTRRFDVNAGVEIDLANGLTWRTSGSYDWNHTRNSSWYDSSAKSAISNGGAYGSMSNKEGYSYQITNTLSYNKSFKQKHNLNVLLGHEVHYSESLTTSDLDIKNFPENNFGLNDIAMGKITKWGSGFSRSGIVSVFGRVSYNYDNRYYANFTMRADGSSKFSKGNKWGYFPSGAVAWRVSEEKFWKDHGIAKVFSSWKIRAGYGTTGNCNIDNNMYATDYGSSDYPVNGTNGPGLAPGNIVGNPNVKWETTRSLNVGMDIGLLNNNLNITADWYSNESKDLLIKAAIPTSTGYSFQYQNVGSIRNRGVEIVINSINFNRKNFRWTTDFNISFNRSKVLSLSGGQDYMPFNVSDRVDYRAIVGQRLGNMYGYQYAGVYTTDDFTQNSDGSYTLRDGVPYLKGSSKALIKPGDVKYKCNAGQLDANGNPIWSSDDKTVIGNGAPKFTGGLSNTFTFHGFDATIFMNFSVGNDVFNMSTQRYIGPYLPNQNTINEMAGRFTLIDPATGKESLDLARLKELNPGQDDPRQMWSLHSTNKIAISDALDYYVEDGSFLRISNITLGYTFPKAWTSKIKLQRARLYFTVDNVCTITGYSGYDPEVSATSAITTPGVDNAAFPRSRSYVVGLNLTF